MSQEKFDRLMQRFCEVGASLFEDGLSGLEKSDPKAYHEIADGIISKALQPCITLEINPVCVVLSVKNSKGECCEVLRTIGGVSSVH